MTSKCPKCQRSLVRNGYTAIGCQRYLCRKDRGGCGYSHTDSSNTHGGARTLKLYENKAEKQRAYRAREKAKAYVVSTQSAEAKAIERIQSIDSVEWETALEPEQEINVEAMNAWLEKRGYKTQVPFEDTPSS